MGAFTLPDRFNANRVFLLNKSELEKRFDPFYYVPEIVELEKKVLKKNPKKLRDYVLRISSGATPKTTESEKYYTDKENGIPFLRVQNLSPTGVLEFEDCKYINKETHSGMLKRSQVFEGDLLVKITGVGRMAVSSVAPDGFEGNINQHICVIRTGSKELSGTIAAYLNSDIGEKLASRRSTGGTRPALDYPALLSIPIVINKRILEITKKAVTLWQKNDSKANKLFKGIDNEILSNLGIKSDTQPDLSLKNRIFNTSLKLISGNRFDSFFYQKKFLENLIAIKKGKYSFKPLREIIDNGLIKGCLPKSEEKNGEVFVVQINSINPDGSVILDDLLKAKNIFSERQRLNKGDILIVITGATIGKIAYWDFLGEFYLGGDMVKFQTKADINSIYIFHFLRCSVIQTEIKRSVTGATNGHLSPSDIMNLPIPIPPRSVQDEIAMQITKIREQIFYLQDNSKDLFKAANNEIKHILLNN